MKFLYKCLLLPFKNCYISKHVFMKWKKRKHIWNRKSEIRDTFILGGIGLQDGKNSKIFGFLFLQNFVVKNWRFCLFVHLFLLLVIVDEKKVGKPTIFCCLNLSVFDILFFLEKILTYALLNNFLNTLFWCCFWCFILYKVVFDELFYVKIFAMIFVKTVLLSSK